ncbi:MAG: hypothetical protein ACXVNO_02570 [Bacteroidia bacterium]
MAPNDLYTKEEAEKLMHSYCCWINKAAHAGNGHIDILTSIAVKPKRIPKQEVKDGKKYIVQFEFANAKKLNAFDFLANNGLIPSATVKINIYTPHTPHTPIS